LAQGFQPKQEAKEIVRYIVRSHGNFSSCCQRVLVFWRRNQPVQHVADASRLDVSTPPRLGALRAHWCLQEQTTGRRRDCQGWLRHSCGVLGHWSRRRPYSTCARWRHSPCWSGNIRQHVPRRRYVRPHQDLAPLAPPCEREREEARDCVRTCGQHFATFGDGSRPQDRSCSRIAIGCVQRC